MGKHLASRSAMVAGFAMLVLLTQIAGRSSEEKTYDPPRLWDGKTPDFRGIWVARTTSYLNIEGHPAEGGVPAAKSIIVDPPDGKIPYKPDALAQRIDNYKNRRTLDPATKCYESGVPRSTYLPAPFQIVQSPGISPSSIRTTIRSV